MNKTLPRRAITTAFLFLVAFFVPLHAGAVEALLLQDTYVDSGTTGGKPPNGSNYGSGLDLRVFKGNGRFGRTFLKFSLATLPPGTAASDVTHARLRFWVNSNSTIAGSITLSPVTSAWDEYTLKDTTTGGLTIGAPKLSDLSVTSVSNFVSIDVTDWVRAWLSGSLVNEGIEVEASGTTTVLNLAFDSKESNQTSHEPRLDIALSKIGPAGPAGPQGPQGTAGVAGLAGPSGATGPAGPPGTPGLTGPMGAQGPQGIAGTNGVKWFSFVGMPAENLGGLSDFYLDLSSGDVWQKVGNEGGPVWALQANIRGAAGLAGPMGSIGAPGPSGPQGPAGLSGSPGSPGPAGPSGEPGAQGPTGPAGPAAVWPSRISPQGDLAMGEFTKGSPP